MRPAAVVVPGCAGTKSLPKHRSPPANMSVKVELFYVEGWEYVPESFGILFSDQRLIPVRLVLIRVPV
jgi:hypothetical protein